MIEPKLRLPGFKDDWCSVRMDELFEEVIEKGRTDLPVLSIRQGAGTVLRDESDRNIQYDKTNLKNYKVIHKGDFIIHLRSFEGGLECSNYDGISSPAYKILRSNKLNTNLYKHYFRSYKFIEEKLGPSVIGIRDGRNIEMNTFWNTKLNIPSIEEQDAMALVIQSVDDMINIIFEDVRLWEEKKKGAMQKIFSQQVRFKNENGEEYPEWEEKIIFDVATCFAGATPSTKIKEYWDNGIIPWMSSGEVNLGAVFETEKKITKLGYDKCSTKMVKPNSVVIALAGQGKTRGTVAITRIPLCTNQSLCAIETNLNIIFPDYLYQYLKTQYENLRMVSSGDGTRGGLNLKLVGEYPVLIPCLEEQQKIADCLSAIDEVISLKKQKLETWKQIKKGLLQQMFI